VTLYTVQHFFFDTQFVIVKKHEIIGTNAAESRYVIIA